MRIRALFLKELRYRLGGFALAVVAVMAMAASLVGAKAFLAAHDHKTEELITSLQERSEERMANLRNEARIFSKNLGFNALVLPEKQSFSEFYAEDKSTAFFSEQQIQAFSEAELANLNHLRPILRQRIQWPEHDREVIIVGVKGEIYIKAPAWQKPIEKSIPAGKVQVGHALGQELDLKKGDTVSLLGEDFTVERVLEQQGGEEDISLRMKLDKAQEILNHRGKISGILALSCRCADANPESMRKEIQSVVPGAKLVQFSQRAHARKKARAEIGEGTKAELQDIKESREKLRKQVASFATVLVTLVTIGSILLLTVLTLNNAHVRRGEVAMLHALGVRAYGIFSLFFLKALLTGVTGGVLGWLTGSGIAVLTSGPDAAVAWGYAAIVIGVATIITLCASAGPAVRVARQDPAGILNQE